MNKKTFNLKETGNLEKETESAKKAKEIYNNIWQKAKSGFHTVPKEWQYLLGGYDEKIGGFIQPQIIPTYSLTVSWVIQNEILNQVNECIIQIKHDFHWLLKDKILWQPLSDTHLDLFKIDKVTSIENRPSDEVVEHRKQTTHKLLSKLAKKLPEITVSVSGLLLMSNGVLALKGHTRFNESLLTFRQKGRELINSYIQKNNDQLINPVPAQDEIYHITIGRMTRELTTAELLELTNYIQYQYFNHDFGTVTIKDAYLTEETGSFAAKRKNYKRIDFKTQ